MGPSSVLVTPPTTAAHKAVEQSAANAVSYSATPLNPKSPQSSTNPTALSPPRSQVAQLILPGPGHLTSVERLAVVLATLDRWLAANPALDIQPCRLDLGSAARSCREASAPRWYAREAGSRRDKRMGSFGTTSPLLPVCTAPPCAPAGDVQYRLRHHGRSRQATVASVRFPLPSGFANQRIEPISLDTNCDLSSLQCRSGPASTDTDWDSHRLVFRSLIAHDVRARRPVP